MIRRARRDIDTGVALAVPIAGRFDAALRGLVGRPLVWVALIAASASWPVVWSLRAEVPAPPPVLGAAPSFRLTDQRGGPFGSNDLAGRVWIASFAGAGAPGGAREMARIQARARNLEPALHLVTFADDRAAETPEQLAAYARAQRASPRMWTFVAGPREVVRSLELGLQGPPEEARAARSLVLVDGAARIRGRYDAASPEAVERLIRDAALLVNRPP